MTSWTNVLVFAKDDPRLFGKILSYEGKYADVEFFLSVAEREVRQLPLERLSHAVLPKQTRAFVTSMDGGWRVGRVVDRFKNENGLFDYTIKFPNDETDELSEQDCYVRCLDRYADPSKILSAYCMETEFFAEHRRRALVRLRTLTSAAHGLTGVISAAVELLPHQVATIRRVVTDRKQRYLLADEVGLGKTIEAGLIIRQLFLDDPTRRFIVAVPGVLIPQWSRELVHKCLLSLDAISVIAHEELTRLSPDEPIDMLIVDEAHRLVQADMVSAASDAARALAVVAARVPRLLLLSATPALGDDRKLLALLNLLDPENYPIDDIAGFSRRVAERQEIGRLLLAMRPDAPAFAIRKMAATAKVMFQNDSVVAEQADRIAGITNEAQRGDVVAGLRDHIASTYRIHQRLIRSRRVDVGASTIRPRGPDWPAFRHVRYLHLQDESSATLADLLERWRGEATLALDDHPVSLAEITNRWDALLDSAWQGSEVIASFAQTATPVFEGEQEVLSLLARLADSGASRVEFIAGIAAEWARTIGSELSGRPKKIVCFVSDTSLAIRVAAAVSEQLGATRVVVLAGKREDSAEAVNALSTSPAIRVLVCDRASEEGLNLQFIYGILHADLPVDATRVEQRIGRLDRFGRKIDGVEHRVILPDDNDAAPWAVWLSILANGFRVFHRSISDVQFRVEELRASISRRTIVHGAKDLEALIDDTAKAIEDERQKLDEQYILEGVAGLIESGSELVTAIEESEEDEEAIERDVNGWIQHVLRLGVSPVGAPGKHILAYSWTEETLTPEIPWRQVVQPSLKHRWTWRRGRSLQSDDQPVLLMRPGSSMCEALERLALWDDRGICYATWRIERGWATPWRGFRLVWIIEPALPLEGPVYARRNGAETARRAAGFLPAITLEQVVNTAGVPTTDPRILAVLDRSYKSSSEHAVQSSYNLGSRPDLLTQALAGASLGELVTSVVDASRRGVLGEASVAAKLNAARQACQRDVERAKRTLEVRKKFALAGSRVIEQPSEGDEEALDLLYHAVTNPSVRLDEIGFYLIASDRP